MAKPFLCNGNSTTLLALGDNGHTIYACALQLRETLRLKEQQEIADCLAIPQENEQGDNIDWYAPFSGSVKSWRVASDTERISAIKQLENYQHIVNALSQQAQYTENSAIRLFGLLLIKIFHFPDQHAIYLVNGKPVITFWGFVNPKEHYATDALSCLRITTPANQPSIPKIVNKKNSRSVKYWFHLGWLLLLVLLLPVLIIRQNTEKNTVATVVPIKEININSIVPSASVVKEPMTGTEKREVMVIPANSVKMKSTRFLNGYWQVIPSTHKSTVTKLKSLNIELKNGAGKANFIKNKNTRCETNIRVSFIPSGNLIINSRYRAYCSNGSREKMPEIECYQNVNGITICSAHYDTETPFPVTIEREKH